MPRSERQGPGGHRGGDPVQPGTRDESWNPLDDTESHWARDRGQWDWHGRPSWGQRLVVAFPVGAIVAAGVLFVASTVAASGPPPPAAVVPGTGGATLTAAWPALPVGIDPTAPGTLDQYRAVTFNQPSGPTHPIEGSTSLTLPPYLGWEANGSAGPALGTTQASGGLLHVGVLSATPDFRGWFLTTTGVVPDSCAFQFDATSPPVVPVTSTGAVGELVMAVQTGTTVHTGDINYVFVAENIHADGQRTLVAGYSTGHVSHAAEHVLKRVPWGPGPLHVSIETNGDERLTVWVGGTLFLDATGLHMGIVPPLQPYLEVQALKTPYTVAYSNYASVCGDDVVISGVPGGSVVDLDGKLAWVAEGRAVLRMPRSAAPITGALIVHLPGASRTLRFAPHTFRPGDRFTYRSAP